LRPLAFLFNVCGVEIHAELGRRLQSQVVILLNLGIAGDRFFRLDVVTGIRAGPCVITVMPLRQIAAADCDRP